MKKICRNCQKQFDEEENFCPLCGAELKTIGSFVEWGENPYAELARESEAQKAEREKRQKRQRVLSRRKSLFSLAFIALLLDFICGIGCILGIFVVIRAAGDYRFLRKEEKKKSTQLVWAITVGVLSTVLGALYLLLFL